MLDENDAEFPETDDFDNTLYFNEWDVNYYELGIFFCRFFVINCFVWLKLELQTKKKRNTQQNVYECVIYLLFFFQSKGILCRHNR